MAKRVRVSNDAGVTYYTLPGNTAELRNEAGEIVDTIFGQAFESNEAGIIGWSITSNALYKGFAGYVATLKQQGATTPTTGEAFSLVSGKTYQIDDTTKQIWDRNNTITIYDNAAPVAAANIESYDYLYGKVTFVASYTPTGAITADLNFFPTADLCGANAFTLTQTAEAIDNTDMCIASSNGGYRTFQYGLKTVSLELSGIFNAANGYLTKLRNRSTVIIEINPDGSQESVCRGFFHSTTHTQSGGVGELEQESNTFQLNVPDDDKLATPFSWNHSVTTTLSEAVKILLDAWESDTTIDAQYLYNGTNGEEGLAIVTEVTLSGGLEVMNEFAVTLQGTGVPSTV